MNYRHQFHAGNFADVMKHALLVLLVRALQKKEKGILFLDTHAGRGRYDLSAAARGDSLERKPEWPEGIGRLWGRTDLTDGLGDYVDLVRRFDADQGGSGEELRFYPGSPSLVRLLARAQDRLALCERQPEEFRALADEMQFAPRTSTHELDGYIALRAMLPPPERRALVLIDPPFEAKTEFEDVVRGLRDGLGRLSGGVFAVWYPLTERARVDRFFDALLTLPLPPTVACELMVAGEASPLRMRGCGLLVLNPPWQFDTVAAPMLQELAKMLGQGAGAESRVEWLVPER